MLKRGGTVTRFNDRLWSAVADRYLQLVVCLAVAALGPALVRWPAEVMTLKMNDGLEASIIGCSISLVVGLVTIRQIAHYPKVRILLYVVPIFLVTFGILLAALLFGRIEFSRYQIGTSFGLSIVLSFFFVHAFARMQRQRFAVVPFGQSALTEDISGAAWIPMHSPAFPTGAADAVVVDLRAELPAEWERFLADCALARIPVYHVKQIVELLTGRVHIEHLSENHLGTLMISRSYEVIKRVTDVMLVATTLPITIPVMAIVAILIKVDSPGPVFFLQRRIGFRGAPFWMIKFRTMREGEEGPAFTASGDPRVTCLGKILRKYRVDELPQIVNVLFGMMSLIGPRPESASLSLWYEKEIPFYRYRHIVRPGITGWAQVNQGHVVGVSEVTSKLQYDFFYIKHFSPCLDILIAFKTAWTVLTGFGSR